MKDQHVSLAAGSAVRLCFDELRQPEWKGRLYTRYKKEPMDFHNAGELLEIMEQFYDWLGYPQASTASRSFRTDRQKGPKEVRRQTGDGNFSSIHKKGEQAVVVSEGEFEKRHGEKATFVVRVQYRQNATWQGQVTWAEKNKTIPFRSALELLKLIDSTEDAGNNVWVMEEDEA